MTSPQDGLRLEQVAEVVAIAVPRPLRTSARQIGASRDRAIAVYPARSLHIEALSDVLTQVFHPAAGWGIV
ncbi:MAG: hypothetical protein AAFY15_06610, partial [Cyanobacteria bacterium J06648_11]